MAWVYLFTAGLIEVAFAVSLKESHGFTRPPYIAATVITGAASLFLLSLALRTLPIGSAYAVWTGLGAAGTAIVGIVLLGEAGNAAKLASIALIIAGVVGLRLAGSE
jgi:quaternary ammonium compound-resistance protein SugE